MKKENLKAIFQRVEKDIELKAESIKVEAEQVGMKMKYELKGMHVVCFRVTIKYKILLIIGIIEFEIFY